MKQKDIIFIIASALFVIIIWIVFDVYHNSITSTISDKLTFQVTPIKGNFDLKTIENIKNRKKIEPSYQIIETLTPTLSPAPIASPTPTINLSQIETETSEASQEGTLLP